MQRTLIVVSLALVVAVSSAQAATAVRLRTTLGDIDLELYDGLAPVTVANFLNYVTDGDYDGSFLHRSVPGIIQGGGFTMAGSNVDGVPTDPSIPNEFNPATMSNTRGTLGMARASALDSARSQWFLNLADNTYLDNPASPYCVFGEVVAGMDVVDAIGALPVKDKTDVHWVLGELPVINYDGGDLTAENVVMLSAAAGVLSGDATFDQVVDGLDYNAWSLHYLQSGHWGGGDFTGDYFVDELDYMHWNNNYGTAGLSSPIPEPSCAVFVLLGLAATGWRRRRA